MKKNLFNITKALLLGLAFVAVGCTDYDEDIKDLNNRIDQVIAGEINPLKADLEKSVANLTAAQQALATEIKAAHKEDIDALKASDETLKASIADANAAIVDLKAQLSAAQDALNSKIDGVESGLNNKIDGVAAELNAKIAEEIANVNEKIAAAEAQIEGLKANVSDLNAKDAELEKKIADLDEEMDALGKELNDLISKNAGDIATNAAAIKTIQENMAQQAKAFADYQTLVAGKIAALEAKDAQIDAAIETINGSIATLQSLKLDAADFESYKADAAAQFEALTEAVEALEYANVKLTNKDKELNKRITDVKNELQAQLDEAYSNIAANTSDIAALQSDVAENLASINATNVALNNAIAQFTAKISALEAKDAELDKKDGELAAEILAKYNELKAADDNLAEQLEAIEADLAEKFAQLSKEDSIIYATIAAECAELAQSDKELLAKIEEEVAKLMAADDAISATVAANYAELVLADEAAAEDLLEKYNELKAADEAAAAEFARLLETSDAKEAVKFAEVWTKLNAMDKENAKQFADLVAKDKELAFLVSNLTGTVDKNAVRIDELTNAITLLKEDLAKYKETVKTEIENAKKDSKDYTDAEIIKLEESTTEKIQALADDLNAEVATLNETIENLKKDIEANMNKLMKRVQSIVYVPDYDDGKATIKYAIMTDGGNTTKIIEAASSMKYQVYPAACAEAIVAAYNNDNSTLRFDVRGVKLASSRGGAAALNIKKVELESANDGIINITFEARGLGDEFYEASKSYSASLVLDYEDDVNYSSANLSSCYTNLTPTVDNTERITVSLSKETKDFDSLYIEYTMRNSDKALEFDSFESDGKKNVLEGCNVVYTIGSTKYTYAQMIEEGYDVAVPTFKYSVKGYNHNPADVVADDATEEDGKFKQATLLGFFDYNNIKDAAELEAGKEADVKTTIQPVVWLTEKATAQTVGSKLEYTGTYNVDGFKLSATQFVVIAPNIIELKASVDDVVWNYADDAEADASRLDADATNDIAYARENLAFNFEMTNDEIVKELDGVKLSDLISSGYTGLDGWNGSGLTKARIANGAKENEVVLAEFETFEWNKEYKITYKYTKNKSVRVDLALTVKTVDRPRDIVVEIPASATVELKKDLKFSTGELEDMKLNAIYTELNDNEDYDLSGMTEADFLEDVLSNNSFVENKTMKADENAAVATTTDTDIVVDNDNATANVSFYYNDFSFIPTKVIYTDDITLWYGQKVKLVYTVDFEMPKAAYNFAHVDLWVKSAETGLYSDVQGNYSPDKTSVALTSFSVSNIDMDKAFVVVDKDDKVVTNLGELGLVTEFAIEDATYDTGIAFTGNVLAYNGKTEFVNVKGNLYLQHTEGQKIALETVFDTDDAYKNYVVNKFDPFTDLVAEDITINIAEVQKYSLDVRSRFSIYESRDGSDNATVLGDGDGFTVDLLTDAGKYIVGNGTNGWASGKKIAGIYGGVYTPVMTFKVADSEIPDKYAHVIKYDEANRVLTFDNTANLELDKPVTIKVDATIDYAWGEEGGKKATLNVTFQPAK
ncbi:MAG: hypothetical protein E7089_05205 [Bacteroidales bacterium]|nr:hypothetical protein [Bacteroidales bacterium]